MDFFLLVPETSIERDSLDENSDKNDEQECRVYDAWEEVATGYSEDHSGEEQRKRHHHQGVINEWLLAGGGLGRLENLKLARAPV